MRWVALRAGGQVTEHFEAPADREVARAIAWAKWGTTVEMVMSAADYYLMLEERAAIERNHRLRLKNNDGDDDAA